MQIDDTVFATASHGVILVSDRDGETVYAISRNIFSPGAAYSATPHSVASLDTETGVLTDVVTGMVSRNDPGRLTSSITQQSVAGDKSDKSELAVMRTGKSSVEKEGDSYDVTYPCN